MTLEEFRKKYGTVMPRLLIGRFIAMAPDFPGDRKLAAEIGVLIADLESVLEGEA